MKFYYVQPVVLASFLLCQFPNSWAIDESSLPVIPDSGNFDPAQVDTVPNPGGKTRGLGDKPIKRLPPAPRTKEEIIRLMKKPSKTRAMGGNHRALSPKARAYINFDSGSAKIKSASRELLDEWAAALQSSEGELASAMVKIIGHTDSDGSEETNIELSEQRATSVKSYLASQGVDEGRFQIVPRGEEQPYVSNATASGKALNRRVEFVFNYSSSGGNENASSGEEQPYLEEGE